jgi:hypothetical protein
MTQNRVQLVVLCEDRQQEIFALNFLNNRGFELDFKNVQVNKSPKGRGSGERYVINNYPKEVRAFRRKNYRSGMLVVVIDADKATVTETLKELDNALIQNSLELRQPNEAIAIFIPKRNIETWIHYLQSETVNEIDAYSKFNKNESICKPYVEQLANKCKKGILDENTPPSLQVACGELQRILPLLDKL